MWPPEFPPCGLIDVVLTLCTLFFRFGFCWMFQSSVLVFDCVVSIKSVLLNLEGYFLGGPGFGFFGDSWFAFPAPLLFCFSAFPAFLLLYFLFFLLLCFSASLLFAVPTSLLFCFSAFLDSLFSASLFFALFVFPVSLLFCFCFSLVMSFCCSTSSFSVLRSLPFFTVSLFVFFLCFILSCLCFCWYLLFTVLTSASRARFCHVFCIFCDNAIM